MRFGLRLLCLLMIVSLVGCASLGRQRPLTANDLSRRNAERMSELEIGMSEESVVRILGSEMVLGYSGGPNLENPYARETVHDRDGNRIVIFFYVTALEAWDGSAEPADLTPLSFQDGALVGKTWGWLEKNVQKYRPR